MAQRSTLRASDEDRDRVADRLHRAATEGRLVAEELEQRLATALRARTYGELDSVVADLPGDRPSRGSRNAPATRRRLAPSPLMLAGLVVAIPVIVAAAIAAIVVLMTVMVMWAVLAIVTWRVFGRHGIPGPWTYARRGRAVRYLRGSRRNAVGGSVPWL